MPEPEIDDVVAPVVPDAAAKELGGFTNEENKFQPDFGSVIDDIATRVKPTLQSAEDVIGDGPIGPASGTGPIGITGPKGSENLGSATGAQTGPTGATQQTGPTGATGAVADDRDKDLNELSTQLGDLTKRPKTKEIIEGYKGKVTQERNARATVEQELTKLRAELEETKKRPVPKDVEEELKALRDTVREIDAARDPAIQTKFDKVITKNEDAILGLLKENGFGLDKDGKEIAGAVDTLKKSGLTRRSLQATIDKLEKSGDGGAIEAAEQIKDLLRTNSQLSKDKQAEVDGYKAGAEDRKKAAEAEMARNVEEANNRIRAQTAEHVAKWDFLKVPADAKPEDSQAVRLEKEKARVAHNDAVNKWNEAIKKETATPADAQIAARIGILYRDVVAPRLQTQLAAARAELETLTNQVKAMKGAGNISGKHVSGSAKPAPVDEGDGSGGFDDVVDAAAKRMGIIK